jgi:hypothetical protein
MKTTALLLTVLLASVAVAEDSNHLTVFQLDPVNERFRITRVTKGHRGSASTWHIKADYPVTIYLLPSEIPDPPRVLDLAKPMCRVKAVLETTTSCPYTPDRIVIFDNRPNRPGELNTVTLDSVRR